MQDLEAEINRLREAIRKHRDQRGDDRCWLDDYELYSVLPEGFTPPTHDTTVELANCEQFIKHRMNPAIEYVSPQREIERLRHALERREREVVAPRLAGAEHLTSLSNTDYLRWIGGMLGAKVQTPDGVGILISVATPSNGLYFEPCRTRLIVWYGTDNAQSGWVSREYSMFEVALVCKASDGQTDKKQSVNADDNAA